MSLSKNELPLREKPIILSVEAVVKTKIFAIEKVRLQFSNGVVREHERFVQWPHGLVMMIPLLDPETMLLIREYSVGIEDYTLTLPKGRVEVGENPAEAADRELREETGYSAKNLILLQSMTQTPSYSSTEMAVFLARDLVLDPLEGDEPEAIEVIPWKLKDIPLLLERDDFNEGRTFAALYLLQQHLEKEAL